MSPDIFRNLIACCMLIAAVALPQAAMAGFGVYQCQTDSDMDSVGYGALIGRHTSSTSLLCGVGTTKVQGWCDNPLICGIWNEYDNCPTVSNTNQADADSDKIGDACDKFPLDASESLDTDNDGIGNSADTDDDGDGVLDVTDNCPTTSNADQLNTDGDTQGNVCDSDDDNDGVADASDKFPLDASESFDTDNDGIGNNADTDDDNDGVLDGDDNCPLNANPSQADTDGDGLPDACTDTDDDNDGISDVNESALGNNPLNNLDPPIAVINSQYIVGVDNRNAESSAPSTVWNIADGTLNNTTFCDFCAVPGAAVTLSASDDVCGVNANGVGCSWWVMDTGEVNNGELLPVQIAWQIYSPFHDWDGYLKYVDSSSVLHNVATDAFKISSDHFSHACIVSKTLGVYCWASHSGTDIVSSTVPVALQNVATVKDVAVGANHACAINGSAVQCWGDTASGKTTVPVIVNAPKQIGAGANHTCAINANGSVSCWGDNSTNQLADSNTDGVVDGVSNALRISAGANHTCAVTGNYNTPSGLRIKCWGDNSAGQTTVPVALTNGVEKPVNITAAGNQTCAVRAGQNVAANAMICWPVAVAP